MRPFESLKSILKETKINFDELKNLYSVISKILVFPSIKVFIEEYEEFENTKYLDHFEGADFEKLLEYLLRCKEISNRYFKQLKLFYKSTHKYLEEKFLIKSNELNGADQDKQSGSLVTVYDIILDNNLTPEEMYKRILEEKTKRKTLNIELLKRRIEEAKDQNKAKKLLYYLRNKDPYSVKRGNFLSKSALDINDKKYKNSIRVIKQPAHSLQSLLDQKRTKLNYYLKNIKTRDFDKKALLEYFDIQQIVQELIQSKIDDKNLQLKGQRVRLSNAASFIREKYSQ